MRKIFSARAQCALVLALALAGTAAQAADKPKAKHAADDYLWLSLGPTAFVSPAGDGGIGMGAGIYGGSHGRLVGLRVAGLINTGAFGCVLSLGFDANSCDNATTTSETGLLMGRISPDHSRWAAVGLSRVAVDGARCEHLENQSSCVTVGVPFELVASPHLSVIGFDVRLYGNLNPINPFVGIGWGLRFGDLD